MKNKFKKYLPDIITGVSCLGVGLTIWLTRISAKHEKPDATVKDNIVLYLPTIISGTATIALIIFNRKLSKAQIASVVTTAGIGTKLYNEYRAKAKEILGDEQFKEIDKQIANDHALGIEYAVSPDIFQDGVVFNSNDSAEDGNVLFYEPFRQRWFRTSREAVRLAWYHLNRNMALGAVATMGQFYTFLGIDPDKDDYSYGWGTEYIEGGCYWIDMTLESATTDNGESYYIISYDWMPEMLMEDEV